MHQQRKRKLTVENNTGSWWLFTRSAVLGLLWCDTK